MLINMILLVDITKIFILCHKYNNIIILLIIVLININLFYKIYNLFIYFSTKRTNFFSTLYNIILSNLFLNTKIQYLHNYINDLMSFFSLFSVSIPFIIWMI